MKQNPKTIHGLLIGVFVLSVLFTGSHFISLMKGEGQQADTKKGNKNIHDPFADISMEATSAYVYDAKTGNILYEHNAETPLPLASVTKVMTGLVATRLAERTSVVIQPDHLVPEGDSGFLVGERWHFDDLRDFTLVTSSNDGAHALASVGALGTNDKETQTVKEGFISKMNDTAEEIGLSQTYYLNPSGLDESEGLPGGYGSAKDMAHLFAYVLENNPEVLAATAAPKLVFSSDTIDHEAENTNEIASQIPGLIASKTGFTDLAGGNLVIAFDAGPDRPIIVSVLGSKKEARFEDVKRLVWASVAAIQQ